MDVRASGRRLLVLYDGSAYGGLERHVELFLRHLDRSRYEPHMLIPGRLRPVLSPALLESLAAEKVEILYTTEGAGGFPGLQMAHDVAAIRALSCDLAFIETCTAIGLRKDLLALRLAGLPIVRMLHMPASAMIEFYGRRWSPREVRLLGRLVASNLVLTDSDKQGLIATFGLRAEKIEVCRQGHDFEKFTAGRPPAEARLALGLDPAVPAIGLVGRFTEQKGHTYLVEAAPLILRDAGPVQFVLVGYGENEEAMRSRVAELGLKDRFAFTGFQRDVRPYIEACDIMVMPSLFESAPMVLLECLAMEKAMVVSDLACFREHVGTEACRLVPPKDSGALAGAIVDLLLHPEKGVALALSGAATVRSRFDVRRHVGQIMTLFDRVALAPRARLSWAGV